MALAYLAAYVLTVLGLVYIMTLMLPADVIPEEFRLVLSAIPGLSLVVSGLTTLGVVRFCNDQGGERDR